MPALLLWSLVLGQESPSDVQLRADAQCQYNTENNGGYCSTCQYDGFCSTGYSCDYRVSPAKCKEDGHEWPALPTSPPTTPAPPTPAPPPNGAAPPTPAPPVCAVAPGRDACALSSISTLAPSASTSCASANAFTAVDPIPYEECNECCQAYAVDPECTRALRAFSCSKGCTPCSQAGLPLCQSVCDAVIAACPTVLDKCPGLFAQLSCATSNTNCVQQVPATDKAAVPPLVTGGPDADGQTQDATTDDGIGLIAIIAIILVVLCLCAVCVFLVWYKSSVNERVAATTRHTQYGHTRRSRSGTQSGRTMQPMAYPQVAQMGSPHPNEAAGTYQDSFFTMAPASTSNYGAPPALSGTYEAAGLSGATSTSSTAQYGAPPALSGTYQAAGLSGTSTASSAAQYGAPPSAQYGTAYGTEGTQYTKA